MEYIYKYIHYVLGVKNPMLQNWEIQSCKVSTHFWSSIKIVISAAIACRDNNTCFLLHHLCQCSIHIMAHTKKRKNILIYHMIICKQSIKTRAPPSSTNTADLVWALKIFHIKWKARKNNYYCHFTDKELNEKNKRSNSSQGKSAAKSATKQRPPDSLLSCPAWYWIPPELCCLHKNTVNTLS